ncbi:MAG: putative toxin-antitoxin system toxin component, PIN family [Candidatus Margulisiibacteriota bacterium]
MPKNTPQAVIDTNVLIRANISKNGSDFLVYRAFLSSKFELLYSEKLIQEINRVLNYPRIHTKYGFDKKKVLEFIESIVTFGRLVFSPKKVKMCRDPNDDELLSIALAIYTKKTIYIVSGDKDILELKGKVKGVKIVTASEFVKSF